MNIISLEQANAIIAAIFERSRELNLRPMSAVVVEPGNVVKAFGKEDHASALRLEMALGKTYAALALGRSSSLVQVRANERPMFMKFIDDASERQVFAEGGGQLIRNEVGEVIGAVGVTGDRQDVDEDMAGHGIHAAGLKTDEDCSDMGQLVRLDN
ncbi:MAG: heme-binding protein [Rhodospirillaceae bacterium]|nr:GlcG protein [Rhodospirillaceae bacterium]RPF95013.1 MAG: heme-binding protein [Rhodospirillaceae bacterium TMED63]RZO38801.1 MAG: heme-binding protein [Rhodospirillaceae bacterium]